MASVSVVPASGLREPSGNAVGVDNLPNEMNDMKIRDDKVNHVTSSCGLYSNFIILRKLLLVLKSGIYFRFLFTGNGGNCC